jgi:hypothetical protein
MANIMHMWLYRQVWQTLDVRGSSDILPANMEVIFQDEETEVGWQQYGQKEAQTHPEIHLKRSPSPQPWLCRRM